MLLVITRQFSDGNGLFGARPAQVQEAQVNHMHREHGRTPCNHTITRVIRIDTSSAYKRGLRWVLFRSN